jgi:hypothetical protein
MIAGLAWPLGFVGAKSESCEGLTMQSSNLELMSAEVSKSLSDAHAQVDQTYS